APKEPLVGQLQALAQRFRSQNAAAKRLSKEPALYEELGRKCLEAWRALRIQAYEEPAMLFTFLRAPENKDVFTQLLLLLGDSAADDGTKLRYPPAFIDALKDLISTGTKAQRREVAG